MADAQLEGKIEKPKEEEPSAGRAQLSSATHRIASISQSMSNIDLLLILRDFVERVGFDVAFAETEEEVRGYLQTKLENARCE